MFKPLELGKLELTSGAQIDGDSEGDSGGGENIWRVKLSQPPANRTLPSS